MSDSTLKVLEAQVGATELGAINVMQDATSVKIGKQTIVDQTGAEVPFATDASVVAVTTSLGTDGATPPAITGTGVRGWLRAIYERLVAGIGRTWSLTSATDSVTTVPSGTQTVSGTVSVGNFPATQPVSGTVAVNNFPATQPVSGTVSVGNFPATQPVSGTVTANLGTLNGAATAANQTNVQSAAGTPNATALTVQGNAGGVPLPVSGPLTDTQLRATPVPVSGPLTDTQLRATAVPVSVGNFPATQAVSGTVTVTQATAGNLNATVTGSVSLASGANSIGNIGTVATITNPVSVTDNGGSLTVDGTITANQGTAGASPWPVSDGGGSLTVDGTVSVGNFPATQNVAITGTGTAAGTPLFAQEVVGGAAVSPTNPVPTRNVPADLAVTTVGAAAAAVTLTIPAPAAGTFHYIDVIEIHLYSTAARTGAAAPVTVTSTNIPGALAWTFPTAGAIGTIDRYAYSGDRPMKSQTAATATTIVCPAVTGGLWRVTAVYSVGP